MYFVGSRNRTRSRAAAADGQMPTVKSVMICTTFRIMSLATVGCCHLMNASSELCISLAPQRAGADDAGWQEAGDRADHQQPGGTAPGDRRGRTHPKVVLEATFGWFWAVDTLVAAGVGPLTAFSRTGGTALDSSVRPGLLMDLDLRIWMQADRQDVLH
jgi:hypothetical protein